MGLRILVVEDEIIIADEICLILSRQGFDVLEPALSYSEAIRSFDEDAPQLVILDVRLSGKKSGLDVARYIRRKSWVPFLFITACGDPKSMEEIAAFEPLACLQKTFLKHELLDKVNLVLERKRMQKNQLPDFTKKEKVILALIRDGYTTMQIAEELKLSSSTIKNHRHNICKKLDLPATTHSLLHWVLKNSDNLKF